MERVISRAVLLIIVTLANCANAQVWSRTGAQTAGWVAVASSSDGTKLAAALTYNIYTSTNAGATWTLTSAPSKMWTGLASSSDGSVLLAAGPLSGVYTSTNSGNTWQSNTVPASASTYWDSAAASADGNTFIIGGQTFGPVCYSTNRGATWRTNGIPTGYWTSVVCSADGSKLAAAWGGLIYVSTNSGMTWTNYNTSPAGSVLACSGDGTRLLMSTPGLALSTNWGATFTPVTIPYTSSTILIAGSANASRMLALVGSSLYLSTNFGTSWTTNYAPSKNWKSIALSSDGTKMIACTTSGADGIYAWWPPKLSLTNTAGNLQLSWPTNGTAFSLQSKTNLTATNWIAVTNAPTITNSQSQVILPGTNGAGFFRLKSQ